MTRPAHAPATRQYGSIAKCDPTRRFPPRRRWLHCLATNLAPDAWRHDQTAGDRAVRAYHHERAVRGQRTKHDDTLAGWWTGPPPYGYRRITQRTRDHRGRLRTRHLLSLDEHRAHVVPTIYNWHLDQRLPLAAIAALLTTDPERYPRPVDHTTGRTRPWTQSIVTGILRCPDYTGYVVRGRTHHGTEQPIANWTWSIGPSHPPLINATQFRAAYNRRQQARQQSRTAQ